VFEAPVGKRRRVDAEVARLPVNVGVRSNPQASYESSTAFFPARESTSGGGLGCCTQGFVRRC